jgi:peptidoglycan/xylan/chitin deacetylase (PgdA/CDA1 family)
MVPGDMALKPGSRVGMRRLRSLFFAAFTATIGVVGTLSAATAQECPGNPDAIGTSRVLVVRPGEYKRLGTMQYPETLPLADKEVVITFDDGPLPPYSNQVLDTLASQCVKATYFLVGEMAHAFPATVQRIYEEGHTIGTHSQSHPLRFDRLSTEKLRWEIDEGIAEVGAALGDPDKLAPFFRIPGLGRSNEVERELASRSLVTFSVDVVADDWHHRIKPAQIISRAMSRLEVQGKGILLLHDIHPVTVAALPGLFKKLKERGFHIVQVVVPAEPSAPETVARRAEWTVAWTNTGQAVMDDSSAGPSWPKFDVNLTPELVDLPAPDAKSFDMGYLLTPVANTADIEAGAETVDADSATVQWPDQPRPVLLSYDPQLPAPSVQDLGVPLRRQVVDEELAPRLGPDTADSTDHARHRHDRLYARRRAHLWTPAVGRNADLFGRIRALTALLSPAPAIHLQHHAVGPASPR